MSVVSFGKSNAGDNFGARLANFYRHKGLVFDYFPKIQGAYINLEKLYSTVQSFGGSFKVTEANKWSEVLNTYGFDKTCVNASFIFKQLFTRYLESFEKYEKGDTQVDDTSNDNDIFNTLSRGAGFIQNTFTKVTQLPPNMKQKFRIKTRQGPLIVIQKLKLCLVSELPNELYWSLDVLRTFAINECAINEAQQHYLSTGALTGVPMALTSLLNTSESKVAQKFLLSLYKSAANSYEGRPNLPSQSSFSFLQSCPFPDEILKSLIRLVFYQTPQQHDGSSSLCQDPDNHSLNIKLWLYHMEDTANLTASTTDIDLDHFRLCHNFEKTERDGEYAKNWKIKLKLILEIFLNWSYIPGNALILAKNYFFLRFLFHAIHLRNLVEEKRHGLDIMANIAKYINLKLMPIDVKDTFFHILDRGCHALERYQLLRTLEVLGFLVINPKTMEGNVYELSQNLPITIYSRICQLLTLSSDIILLCRCLETIYQLTYFGSSIESKSTNRIKFKNYIFCERFRQQIGFIDILINLMTHRASLKSLFTEISSINKKRFLSSSSSCSSLSSATKSSSYAINQPLMLVEPPVARNLGLNKCNEGNPYLMTANLNSNSNSNRLETTDSTANHTIPNNTHSKESTTPFYQNQRSPLLCDHNNENAFEQKSHPLLPNSNPNLNPNSNLNNALFMSPSGSSRRGQYRNPAAEKALICASPLTGPNFNSLFCKNEVNTPTASLKDGAIGATTPNLSDIKPLPKTRIVYATPMHASPHNNPEHFQAARFAERWFRAYYEPYYECITPRAEMLNCYYTYGKRYFRDTFKPLKYTSLCNCIKRAFPKAKIDRKIRDNGQLQVLLVGVRKRPIPLPIEQVPELTPREYLPAGHKSVIDGDMLLLGSSSSKRRKPGIGGRRKSNKINKNDNSIESITSTVSFNDTSTTTTTPCPLLASSFVEEDTTTTTIPTIDESSKDVPDEEKLEKLENLDNSTFQDTPTTNFNLTPCRNDYFDSPVSPSILRPWCSEKENCGTQSTLIGMTTPDSQLTPKVDSNQEYPNFSKISKSIPFSSAAPLPLTIIIPSCKIPLSPSCTTTLFNVNTTTTTIKNEYSHASTDSFPSPTPSGKSTSSSKACQERLLWTTPTNREILLKAGYRHNSKNNKKYHPQHNIKEDFLGKIESEECSISPTSTTLSSINSHTSLLLSTVESMPDLTNHILPITPSIKRENSWQLSPVQVNEAATTTLSSPPRNNNYRFTSPFLSRYNTTYYNSNFMNKLSKTYPPYPASTSNFSSSPSTSFLLNRKKRLGRPKGTFGPKKRQLIESLHANPNVDINAIDFRAIRAKYPRKSRSNKRGNSIISSLTMMNMNLNSNNPLNTNYPPTPSTPITSVPSCLLPPTLQPNHESLAHFNNHLNSINPINNLSNNNKKSSIFPELIPQITQIPTILPVPTTTPSQDDAMPSSNINLLHHGSNGRGGNVHKFQSQPATFFPNQNSQSSDSFQRSLTSLLADFENSSVALVAAAQINTEQPCDNHGDITPKDTTNVESNVGSTAETLSQSNEESDSPLLCARLLCSATAVTNTVCSNALNFETTFPSCKPFHFSNCQDSNNFSLQNGPDSSFITNTAVPSAVTGALELNEKTDNEQILQSSPSRIYASEISDNATDALCLLTSASSPLEASQSFQTADQEIPCNGTFKPEDANFNNSKTNISSVEPSSLIQPQDEITTKQLSPDICDKSIQGHEVKMSTKLPDLVLSITSSSVTILQCLTNNTLNHDNEESLNSVITSTTNINTNPESQDLMYKTCPIQKASTSSVPSIATSLDNFTSLLTNGSEISQDVNNVQSFENNISHPAPTSPPIPENSKTIDYNSDKEFLLQEEDSSFDNTFKQQQQQHNNTIINGCIYNKSTLEQRFIQKAAPTTELDLVKGDDYTIYEPANPIIESNTSDSNTLPDELSNDVHVGLTDELSISIDTNSAKPNFEKANKLLCDLIDKSCSPPGSDNSNCIYPLQTTAISVIPTAGSDLINTSTPINTFNTEYVEPFGLHATNTHTCETPPLPVIKDSIKPLEKTLKLEDCPSSEGTFNPLNKSITADEKCHGIDGNDEEILKVTNKVKVENDGHTLSLTPGYKCGWVDCNFTSTKLKSILSHAYFDHLTEDGFCKWYPCFSTEPNVGTSFPAIKQIYRTKYSLFNHIQDYHFSPQNAQLMVSQIPKPTPNQTQSDRLISPLPSDQSNTNGMISVVSSPSNPHHKLIVRETATDGSSRKPDYSALQTIYRYFNYSVASSYQQSQEVQASSDNNVSFSINVLSTLILRNIAKYSILGKQKIRVYESQITSMNANNPDLCWAISQLLWELSR